MRPQRFHTYYVTAGGLLMVLAETFVILIRMDNGLCGRFTYAQLGFGDIAHAREDESPTTATGQPGRPVTDGDR